MIIAKKDFIRLTPIQTNMLQLLFDGSLMTIDRKNTATVCEKPVALITRYFLTKNKLVTRKDKSKSIHTKANGYIISDKGKRILILNKRIIRRKAPKILLMEKKCAKCEIVKPISLFVTIYGFNNPRGKYCEDCFLKSERENAIALLEGRDFCLYCGKKIDRVYEWTETGKSAKTYIHSDHMDPISLGGKDTKSNIVNCCRECNIRKSNKPFIEWLKILKPEYSTLARDIYIKKHKHLPEKFKPYFEEFEIEISI